MRHTHGDLKPADRARRAHAWPDDLRPRRGRARRGVPVLLAALTVGGIGLVAPLASGAVGHAPVWLDASSSASPSSAGPSHPKVRSPVVMGVDGTPSSGGTTAPAAGSPSASATSGAPEAAATIPGHQPTGTTTAAAPGTAAGTATSATSTSTSATSAAPSSPSAGSSAPSSPGSSSSSAPPPAPVLVPDAGDAVLTAVNAARSAQGCAALTADDTLTGRAEANSLDMAAAGTLAVQDPAGSASAVQHGAGDAASVVAAWLADPADSAHLLDCAVTTAGAAEATAGSGNAAPWWTLFLA